MRALILAVCVILVLPGSSGAETNAPLFTDLCAGKTPARCALAIEAHWGINTNDGERALDHIEKRIFRMVGEKPRRDYAASVRFVNVVNYGLHELGYSRGDVNLFSTALVTKVLDCSDRTLIYLGFAERLGMPTPAVNGPGHVFLRLTTASARQEMNWETTTGAFFDKDQYVKDFHISRTAIEHETYFRDLAPGEIQYATLLEIGVYYARLNNLKLAFAAFDRAASILPRDPNAHFSKADMLLEAGQPEEALQEIRKAIARDPDRLDIWGRVGLIYRRLGKTPEETEAEIARLAASAGR